jgi:hypothetical protein
MTILAILAAVAAAPATARPATASSGLASAETGQVSAFTPGATMTQYSLDPWGNADAVADGKALLESSTGNVAQHLHGFGGVFPVAEDGTEDWTALDRRFLHALDGVEHVVLTACCAPAHMEQPDGDDDPGAYSPYLRPKPEFYQDYADVVLATVERYPNITHIQVWNEMKGFWDPDRNRWDYVAYTNLYNTIWNTVKPARPDIKIGGPYVVLNSYGTPQWFDSTVTGPWGTYDKRDLDVITYWLKNKAGADFIAVDGKIFNRDGVQLVDDFAAAAKFGAFTDWLRALRPKRFIGADTLPIWWSEIYATPSSNQPGQVEKNAVMTHTVMSLIRSGAATAMIWGPQGDENGDSFPLGMFTDTRVDDGGRPTSFAATQLFVRRHVTPGTPLLDVVSTNRAVSVLATPTGRIMVNTTGRPQVAAIVDRDNRPGNLVSAFSYQTLDPYEVVITPAQ